MLPIVIKTVEHKPADLSMRAHREISREAFTGMGTEWHQHMLPLRFTANSPHYPRKKRTRRYLARKQKLYEAGKIEAPNIDNLLTGASRDAFKLPAIARAYPTRVTVQVEAPKYFGMRPYKSTQPDKWAEITWISGAEQQKLSTVWLGTYDRLREQRNETRTFSTG